MRTVAAMTSSEREGRMRALVSVEEIADLIVRLARDETLAGRVLVRWADEAESRLLPQERL